MLSFVIPARNEEVLAREWDSWFASRQADTDRSPLPAYVEREVEAFFPCGLLHHGFVILSCETLEGAVGSVDTFEADRGAFRRDDHGTEVVEIAIILIDVVVQPEVDPILGATVDEVATPGDERIPRGVDTDVGNASVLALGDNFEADQVAAL
jgi:hypothetical protein